MASRHGGQIEIHPEDRNLLQIVAIATTQSRRSESPPLAPVGEDLIRLADSCPWLICRLS
jgi:hypothetical protein